MDTLERVMNLYRERFGEEPTYVVRAPGRVNLLGEHTDYNEGYVLPMAIEQAMYAAFSPVDSHRLNLYLADFDRIASFDINKPIQREKSPLEYIKGVTQALINRDKDLHAWQGVIAGDVPMGAGLSSSAAFGMAALYAYYTVNSFRLIKVERAKLGQWVENEWLGVNSGIMDQMAVVHGVKGNAIQIDCRSLKTKEIPLPEGTLVAILDTGTRRNLDGSAYNDRVAECGAAAEFFGVDSLRDLDMKTFEEKANEMDEIPRKRARHVLTENERVLAASAAAKKGDAETFGKLMNESHISMRDDFEISSDALNSIVEHAQAHEGCYGARMTGGGFAGCGVALIKAEAAADFIETVGKAYEHDTKNAPKIYITEATDGAGTIIRND